MDVDIAILGAGPAGAAMACTLASRHRVLLVDRRQVPEARIGESLIPAARRLLRDMRLLKAFEAEGHASYLGNRSHWGRPAAQIADFMSDPDGPGWHICRPRFERFLREAARQRGADLACPAHVERLERDGRAWRLKLRYGGRQYDVAARVIVDASGRSAAIAKRIGATRRNTDRLVALWLHGVDGHGPVEDAGFSTIESARDGWWYTARVPVDGDSSRGRVLAFHTDRDIAPTGTFDAGQLTEAAAGLTGLGPLLRRSGFQAGGPVRRTAANSASLAPPAGDGWLAIGDAALSFDPLSSRGLFNALYTAFAGSMACHDHLEGTHGSFAAYRADAERIRRAYEHQLHSLYGTERRWPDALFWRRRMPHLLAAAGAV